MVSNLSHYSADMKKDASVNVRLTSELRSKLQGLADADGRKLSNYIERLLTAHVEGLEGDRDRRNTGAAKRR